MSPLRPLLLLLPLLLPLVAWLTARAGQQQTYVEATAGIVSLGGFAKSIDMQAVLATVGGCVLLGGLLRQPAWARRLLPTSARQRRRWAWAGLLVGLLPCGVVWVAGFDAMATLLLLPWLLGVAALGRPTSAPWLVATRLAWRPIAALLGALLFCAVFAGPCLSLLLSRGLGCSLALADPLGRLLAYGLVALSSLVLMGPFYGEPAAHRWAQDLALRILVPVQCLLPAGLLSLLPPAVRLPAQSYTPATPRPHLRALLLAAALLVAGSVLLRALRQLRGHRQAALARPLHWPAACCAALSALLPAYVGQQLSPDDYHFGELLLPWDQWQRFGAVPFVDFVPAHGLGEFFIGGVAQAFFEPTALGHLAASRLLIGVFALLCGWRLISLLGPVAGGLCGLGAAMYAPALGSWTFLVVAYLATLASPALWRQPRRWLWLWAYAGAALALILVIQGSGMVLASFPFAVHQLWRLWRRGRGAQVGRLLAGLLPLLGALLVWPTGRQIGWGLFTHLLYNARTNTISFGSPLGQPYIDSLWRSVWRGLLSNPQMVWLPAVGAWAVYAIAQRAHLARRCNRRLFFLASVYALYCVATVGYHMGRIEPPQFWSRPGVLTLLWLFFILPMGAYLCLRRRPAPLTGLALFWILGPVGLGSAAAERAWGQSRAQSAHIALAPAQARLRTGAVHLQPDHLADLEHVAASVARLLTPAETFADLTNRNALYFYLGRRAPTRVSAFYNVANAWSERRFLDDWRRASPQLVFIGPRRVDFDGAPPSLRMRHFFAHLLQHYRAVQDAAGSLWMVPTGRADLQAALQAPQAQVLTITDANWRGGLAHDGRACVLQLPPAVYGLAPGMRVRLAETHRATITQIRGDQLFFAPPLAPQDLPAGAWGVRPEGTAALLPERLSQGLLQRIFHVEDLQHLPRAWGQGLRQDAVRWQPLASVAAPAAAGHACVDLTAHLPALRRASLLGLQLHCAAAAPPGAQALLRLSGGAAAYPGAAQLRWALEGDRFVVPLDGFVALHAAASPSERLLLELPCALAEPLRLRVGVDAAFADDAAAAALAAGPRR